MRSSAGRIAATADPHIILFLREAQRKGTRVIVIDPIRTLTARSADQHIQPFPGTDAALALAMMHVMVMEGLHRPDWIAAPTIRWQSLRDRLIQFPPHLAAQLPVLP